MDKITNRIIFDSWGSVQTLARKSYKGKTAYRIAREVKKIQAEYKIIEELRLELITKYGAKVDEKMEVLPENHEVFMSEINAILDAECELEINTIDVAELVDSTEKDINIEPAILMQLDWFIVEIA